MNICLIVGTCPHCGSQHLSPPLLRMSCGDFAINLPDFTNSKATAPELWKNWYGESRWNPAWPCLDSPTDKNDFHHFVNCIKTQQNQLASQQIGGIYFYMVSDKPRCQVGVSEPSVWPNDFSKSPIYKIHCCILVTTLMRCTLRSLWYNLYSMLCWSTLYREHGWKPTLKFNTVW